MLVPKQVAPKQIAPMWVAPSWTATLADPIMALVGTLADSPSQVCMLDQAGE